MSHCHTHLDMVSMCECAAVGERFNCFTKLQRKHVNKNVTLKKTTHKQKAEQTAIR